jgi:hypothetical protein
MEMTKIKKKWVAINGNVAVDKLLHIKREYTKLTGKPISYDVIVGKALLNAKLEDYLS